MMHFTVILTTELNALGVAKVCELFPSSHMIETIHAEIREAEYRVTYCHSKTPCPNDCQCEAWELPAKAAESLLHAWPDQMDAIMKDIRRAGGNLDAYYSFNRWGMYVGVEHDGYIHT